MPVRSKLNMMVCPPERAVGGGGLPDTETRRKFDVRPMAPGSTLNWPANASTDIEKRPSVNDGSLNAHEPLTPRHEPVEGPWPLGSGKKPALKASPAERSPQPGKISTDPNGGLGVLPVRSKLKVTVEGAVTVTGAACAGSPSASNNVASIAQVISDTAPFVTLAPFFVTPFESRRARLLPRGRRSGWEGGANLQRRCEIGSSVAEAQEPRPASRV